MSSRTLSSSVFSNSMQQNSTPSKVWSRKSQEWIEAAPQPMKQPMMVPSAEQRVSLSHPNVETAPPGKSGVPHYPRQAVAGAPVSSNAFANGSNQNCGNVISERSTTRIHCPPGGRSTFSFTGEEPKSTQKPQRVADPNHGHSSHESRNSGLQMSSNAFASGSNQNAGNFITEKPTTRVRAPPGGSSSLVLG